MNEQTDQKVYNWMALVVIAISGLCAIAAACWMVITWIVTGEFPFSVLNVGGPGKWPGT